MALFFARCVMIHHAVYVSRTHQNSEPRSAEFCEIIRTMPIRQSRNTNLISMLFKHARNYGVSKTRMVHIRVPHNIKKIKLVPAALFHVRPRYGKKIVIHHTIPSSSSPSLSVFAKAASVFIYWILSKYT